MMYRAYPLRLFTLAESRLVYFAGGNAPPNAPQEQEVALDKVMKLDSPDAIKRAKETRITHAGNELKTIDADVQQKLQGVARSEMEELMKGRDDQKPDDVRDVTQQIQDRFAHADILATYVIDQATNAVSWTFEPLAMTPGDFDASVQPDLQQKIADTVNASDPMYQLVFKEFLKGCTQEQLEKFSTIADTPGAKEALANSLNVMNWNGTKEEIDASIAAIPDPQHRAAIETFRDAFGDQKIGTLQTSLGRIDSQKPNSQAESGVQLTPEQQKKLDNSLNTNISKMKDYEVMRVQGQIMMDFGVNVVVEGEGDARKLKAEPVDEKSQKFTKFMGLIMVAGSYIAQLMELKNRIEGKSTGDGKEKPADATPEPKPEPASGDQPPVEQPGETPDATALKKGEEKLVAAGAKKEGDVHSLETDKLNNFPQFRFKDGGWQFKGKTDNDTAWAVVTDASSYGAAPDAEAQKIVDTWNAILKEIGDINKDGNESKTKNGVDTFNAENPIAEARANGDRIELFIKDESQCSAMALERKCALTAMNGVRVDGGNLSIANTDENRAKLPELKNNLTKTVRESPEKMHQLYLMALAEAIDAADPVSGLKGSIIDNSKASDPDVANRLKSSADIVSAIRSHLKADASTNFMVMKGGGNDNLYLNDGYTNDTDLIYGFGTMISGSVDTVKQALEKIVGDQTVEKFANISESGEKNRYEQFRGVLEKKMRGLEKQYSK